MRIFGYIGVSLLFAASGIADKGAEKAADIFHKAEKLEKSGRIVEAYVLYADAARLDPVNPIYRAKTALLKPVADKTQIASVPPPEPAPDIEPDFDSITARELAAAKRALPPPELKLATGRFDFHFSGGAKDLFNQVANRCGLQTVFDGEYDQPPPPKVRFDLDDADCRTALHAAEAATGSFLAPLSSKLILISKDTPAKRAANEPTMSVVVPVQTALSVQELTEISQAVKQVTGVEKLAWSAATNEILIRDRISRAIPARALIEQLTSYRGTILIELRFLQLSNSDILSYGVDLTNTFNVVYAGVSAPTLANIWKVFNTHMFAINGINASIVANLTRSSSRTLLETRLRAVSGFPSTFHSGQKYPILTSQYIGGTASAVNGAYTPPPSFTYEDLGVSLKITPFVGQDLITMDVDTEYQLLGGTSINGIPILTNRKYSSRISLHPDEWAVIGGLMDETNSKSDAGVAGLAGIPLVGWLFKTRNTEKDRDHIIILMKPWVVGGPPGGEASPAMAVGADTRPLSPIL